MQLNMIFNLIQVDIHLYLKMVEYWIVNVLIYLVITVIMIVRSFYVLDQIQQEILLNMLKI